MKMLAQKKRCMDGEEEEEEEVLVLKNWEDWVKETLRIIEQCGEAVVGALIEEIEMMTGMRIVAGM